MNKKASKIKIGVIYGGPSKEHDVSLATAKSVLKHLDRNKYLVVPIKISRTGRWPKGYLPQTLKKKIDFTFLAMHGHFGEDGTIQAILENYGVPYSGSGVAASCLAMNKYLSQQLAGSIGLLTPRTWLIGIDEVSIKDLPAQLVLKPNADGSTNGVKLFTKTELAKISNWQKKYRGYLLQERIFGRELTVPILGKKPLPAIEIISKREIYDYQAKYQANMSSHIVSPSLPEKTKQTLNRQALAIHKLLGCKVYSRSDFLLKGNKLYYLETNTLPGMTATSLLPESASSAGISFPKLLDIIIQLSQS